MDPFKLLSRSTKLSRSTQHRQHATTPSSGQKAQPQLFSAGAGDSNPRKTDSRKRKRDQDGGDALPVEETTAIDFFGGGSRKDDGTKKHIVSRPAIHGPSVDGANVEEKNEELSTDHVPMSLEERQTVLRKHKLKITYLNPTLASKKERRKVRSTAKSGSKSKPLLFPEPLQSFDKLSSHYGISKTLVANVVDQGFTVPTEVQLAGLPLLLGEPTSYLPKSSEHEVQVPGAEIDLLTVAPTGSGKTLAYMIPLLHRIQLRKRAEPDSSRCMSTIILVPTKELAGQIVNESRKLSKGTGISISQMRKGMTLEPADHDSDSREIMTKNESVVKVDIIVSTPGVLQSLIDGHANTKALSQVNQLVLDEADVLLDPLFRQQTLDIWNSLSNPSLRTSLWSATMGSNIEELAKSTIEERRRRMAAESAITIPAAPVVRLVVGLKDSAVPNVQHKLVYAATEQGKLMGLRQLLHPTTSSVDVGPPLRPPFLVFTQTIERAIALHAELLYDIPAEAGGISRIAVLHSDLSDTARNSVMTRFRKGEIWILITTDLLSRGVDFRGINGVVNYDIPTSSAAYVHRVGRTGRAGRDGGVAVTLYSREDIPYLKHVANVVAMAHKIKGDDEGMQKWLLEAIPTLSKNEKQNLKKRGIESRTARGRESDPKAARRARISTKAGFVRQAENKRKGAILGTQRRTELEQNADEGDETDFGGFD